MSPNTCVYCGSLQDPMSPVDSNPRGHSRYLLASRINMELAQIYTLATLAVDFHSGGEDVKFRDISSYMSVILWQFRCQLV